MLDHQSMPADLPEASDPHGLDAGANSKLEDFERAITRWMLLEQKLFSVQLERFEVTPAQYHALVHMARQAQACTMGCLAEHLHQSSATTTGIVDRLVRRNLAERRPDAADRRRVMVRITESGFRLVSEAHAARRQRTTVILSSLSEEDRRLLCALLEQYVDSIAEELGEGRR
jgi:DNA-binding MarR family transcriptional regulator